MSWFLLWGKISNPDTLFDQILLEYRFDYSKAQPSRFVRRHNPMPKPRRKPPHVVSLPRLVVPVGLSLVLALSIVGFVYYTKITLEKQARFAPDSAHPWDGYAALCLFSAMAAIALLLLNKRDPPPMRWRRGRASTRFSARSRTPQRQAKRRRAGTIPLP